MGLFRGPGSGGLLRQLPAASIANVKGIITASVLAAVLGGVIAAGVTVALVNVWGDEDGHGAFCEAAKPWRDAAQEMEFTGNSVNRGSTEGRRELNDKFVSLARLPLPMTKAGTPERELAERMEAVTAAEEEWLSQGSKFFSVIEASNSGGSSTAQVLAARDSYEKARLDINANLRGANSLLTSVCGLEVIQIYGTPTPAGR